MFLKLFSSGRKRAFQPVRHLQRRRAVFEPLEARALLSIGPMQPLPLPDAGLAPIAADFPALWPAATSEMPAANVSGDPAVAQEETSPRQWGIATNLTLSWSETSGMTITWKATDGYIPYGAINFWCQNLPEGSGYPVESPETYPVKFSSSGTLKIPAATVLKMVNAAGGPYKYAYAWFVPKGDDSIYYDDSDWEYTVVESDTANVGTKVTLVPDPGWTTPHRAVVGEWFGYYAWVEGDDGGAPTGTVTYTVDGNDYTEELVVVAGQSAAPWPGIPSLHAGTYPITAKYEGDNKTYKPSKLAKQSVTISRADTETSVNASPRSVVYGQEVTLTGSVDVVPPGKAVEDWLDDGTVTFRSGRTSVTGTPNGGGVFTGATSALPVGSHTFVGTFSGNRDYNRSTSTNNVTLDVLRAPTTTVVTAAPATTTYGQAVTFTATVNPANPMAAGLARPGGTVTFSVDSGKITSTVPLRNGTAAFTTNAMNVGTHTILATYVGDANYTSSSDTASATVNKATTAITGFASRPNPSVYGQGVTFAGVLVPGSLGPSPPSGPVVFMDTFYNPTRMIGLDNTLPLRGPFRFDITTVGTDLDTGAHAVWAMYLGDDNYLPSQAVVSQVVNAAPTTTQLWTSPSASPFGESVTLTAKVSASRSGIGLPEGTVTFLDNGNPLGTVNLSSGEAVLKVSSLTVGTHRLTARYNGLGNYAASTSRNVSYKVREAPTSTELVASVNPSVFGQPVKLTATVRAGAGTGTPTGTITFTDKGKRLPGDSIVALSNGSASFTVNGLPAGSHSFVAVYTPTPKSNHDDSKSVAAAHTVNKAQTTTTLKDSASPSVFGQPVTLEATVTVQAPGGGTPTGTVTFLDHGKPLKGKSTVKLVDGKATLTVANLATGDHTLTAAYKGDKNVDPSTSIGVSHTVEMAATTTTLVASPNPSVSGKTVKFTAVVAAVAPGTGTPTGTVTFLDNGEPLEGKSTVKLGGGKATFSTSKLSVGTHTITAIYSSDANYAGSTSTGTTLIVAPKTGASAADGAAAVSGTGIRVGDEAETVLAASLASNAAKRRAADAALSALIAGESLSDTDDGLLVGPGVFLPE